MDASDLDPIDTPAPSEAVPPEKAPLETQLLRAGLLTLRRLTEAQKAAAESGKPLEETLVEGGWVSAEDLAKLSADNEPQAEPPTAPPLYVVYANLDTGERLEVSEHDDQASARVAAAGAVELVESNEAAVLEIGERKFPASAVASIEIVEIT